MNGTPQVGEPCQYVVNGGGSGDGPKPGVLQAVNTDGTVYGKVDDGSRSQTHMPYVTVGGTPPTPGGGVDYIQALL